MQISNQEVNKIQQTTKASKRMKRDTPVTSVSELAAKNGVRMDEVQRVSERVMMSEEDILRERRVQELARRVAAGTYRVEAEDIVDMAERRAIADRSGEL